MTDPVFREADLGTSYTQSIGEVIDPQPRIISNLVADQNATGNPAAAAVDIDGDGIIPNVDSDARRRSISGSRSSVSSSTMDWISSTKAGAEWCPSRCNPTTLFTRKAARPTSWC